MERVVDNLRTQLGGKTRAEVIRQALETERKIREQVDADLAADKLPPSERDALTRSRLAGYAAVRLSVASNRKAVIQYSNVLIVALEDALSYDPKRHHNSPSPALHVEDENYLTDLSALVAQLKRLNDLLERHDNKKQSADAAVDVREHLNLFLKNYIPVLGKGSAVLTVGVAGALLHSMGIGSGVVDQLLAHLLHVK